MALSPVVQVFSKGDPKRWREFRYSNWKFFFLNAIISGLMANFDDLCRFYEHTIPVLDVLVRVSSFPYVDLNENCCDLCLC